MFGPIKSRADFSVLLEPLFLDRRFAAWKRRGETKKTMQAKKSKPFSYEKFPSDGLVAYFSMEIAINPSMPTYSGGLGVLAGDSLRSAADLGVPLVAFTLAAP